MGAVALNESTANLIERNIENGFLDLDDQHKAFVYKYVGNGYDHRAAAKEVGIPPNSALNIVRIPLVSAFVAQLQKQSYLHETITKDFVVSQYMNLLDIALGNQEVPLVTGSGVEIDARKFMPELAAKCVDKLSNLVPEFKDNSAASGGVNIVLNFDAVRGETSPEVVING